MTDITKAFRALIKANQSSGDPSLRLQKPSKKPEHISTRFLSQAKLILSDINNLKHLLIEGRTNYLSPSYLLSTTNRIMTDQQRLDFEEKVEKQIKQCREELEKLKASIGQISFSGQRRFHYELVGAYLERDLVQCTKIYTEQKCLRHKRETERKKIGRLDHEEQQMLLNINAKRQRPTSPPSTFDTTSAEEKNRPTKPVSNLSEQSSPQPPSTGSPSMIVTTTSYYNEETSQIPVPQPTGQELHQLQQENQQLYHDLAQRSEEIREISSQVVEIAQLQNELFDNIFVQKDLIEHIDASAVASNDDIAAAIVHIRDAIRNAAQMRRWVIFFLMVMIFSLLFLDWYNV